MISPELLRLLPDGGVAVALIIVVVLFLKNQADRDKTFVKEVDHMNERCHERLRDAEKQFGASLDRVCDTLEKHTDRLEKSTKEIAKTQELLRVALFRGDTHVRSNTRTNQQDMGS